MEKERKYGFMIRCKNCGSRKGVRIPWGGNVKDFLATYEEKCGRCGVCEWEGVEFL